MPTHPTNREWLVEYTFTDSEQLKLEQVLKGLPDVNASPLPAMRFMQRHFAAGCPPDLIDHLFDMRTNASGPSVILVHNGPKCALPPTPLSGDSRGTHKTFTLHGYLMGMMMQLGHLVSHIAQKRGALIADVVPRPGFEQSISNAGSAQPLDLHIEDVHLDRGQRPTNVGLLCLRPDPEGRAETMVVDLRDILPRLEQEALRELRLPNFIIDQSESFTGGPQQSRPMAILSGADDLPEVAVEFNTTRALTAGAVGALEAFKQAARQATMALKLSTRDLLIVCNRRTLHGRGVFRPRFEPGRDNRWLLRLSVVADPYLIRDVVAPGGVRILEVKASELPDLVRTAAGAAGISLASPAVTPEASRACLSRYNEWLNAIGAGERPLIHRLRTEFAVFVAGEIAVGRLLTSGCLAHEDLIRLAIALVQNVEREAMTNPQPASTICLDVATLATALRSSGCSVPELMTKAARSCS